MKEPEKELNRFLELVADRVEERSVDTTCGVRSWRIGIFLFKERFREFAEVEFKEARDDVGVSDCVNWRNLALLERAAELSDLAEASREPEKALLVKAVLLEERERVNHDVRYPSHRC